MPSERLILRFPDGQSESRNPPVDLIIGDRLTRRMREWVVASVDAHDPEVTVVVLRGAPPLEDEQPQLSSLALRDG